MTDPPSSSDHGAIPAIRVRVAGSEGELKRFTKSFRLGRAPDADFCIANEFISRYHAEIVLADGEWSIRDLGSVNGLYVNGQRVPGAAVEPLLDVRLGVEGPWLHLEVEAPKAAPPAAAPVFRPKQAVPLPAAPPAAATSVTSKNVKRYFEKSAGTEPVGEHTRMIRIAFEEIQTKQKRKYGGMVAALGVCVLLASVYALYLRHQVNQQKSAAVDLFYQMKSLDLDIAGVESLVSETHSVRGEEELQKFRDRRRQVEKSYDGFLTNLQVYDPKMTPQQRLVLKIARIFGECEATMPPEFMTEIDNYIQKWKTSDRLAGAIKRAQDNGYVSVIGKDLLARGLPPQFFYLALQESNFDPYISGPPTRSGIAKGMWQFVPATAVQYGLRIGPLSDQPRPDPADDRHHWDRATKAAASYLADLYSTDAQASGFLVMSCYNWGEGSVLPLVRKMPPNPKDRNFWRLLAMGKDKIPKETYDYVFYIASAAVIGEDPRLFGFNFDNPLASVGN